MSNTLQKAVWEYGPDDPTQHHVLLALANYANDDGGSVFPSLETIAARCRISRRTAARAMKMLAADGWITATRRGPTSNIYTIQVAKLSPSSVTVAQQEPERSANLTPKKCQIDTSRSAKLTPDPISITNHLIEEEEAPAPATPLQVVAGHFTSRTAIQPNGTTPNYGRDWRQPLEAILALAGNDPPAACVLIDRALAVAWGENEQRKVYTVSAPRSIAGIAANLAAQQRNGASAADADSLWQQALDVVTGTKTSDSRLLTAIRAIGADRIRMARESDAPRLKQELAHGYYRPVTTAA